MSEHYFPTCEAYGERVRASLPGDCPMRAEAAYRAMKSLLDRGFELLDPNKPEGIPEGLWLVDRGQRVCYGCVSRLVKNPTIQRLRSQIQGGSTRVRAAADVDRRMPSRKHPARPSQPAAICKAPTLEWRGQI